MKLKLALLNLIFNANQIGANLCVEKVFKSRLENTLLCFPLRYKKKLHFVFIGQLPQFGFCLHIVLVKSIIP